MTCTGYYYTPPDVFLGLVNSISSILGPTYGLDSKDIDVRELYSLMEEYVSKESEWSQFAFKDKSRGYTRNLVSEGNESYNLVKLPPQSS